MTALPPPSKKKLGLVIDLDTCVGCHACAVSCKEWNAGGFAAPLTDERPYGEDPSGVWFNRVHSYELAPEPASGGCGGAPATAAQPAMTLHFPRSCLHCEQPACVTVCPTGASFKRAEDGIVLVDEDKCIGCKLCSWACPYGAREYSAVEGVMKKCTLCIDRIYNENLSEAERQPACVQACPTRARHFGDLGDPESAVSKLVAERGGVDLMAQLGYQPTNKYLPPRPRRAEETRAPAPPQETLDPQALPTVLRWLDKVLSR
ncbi:4Fe-4S dicluster domain-containing protein [Lysobacter sp. K5869]|uniref:4Fe-4S dicluster domain-containing protein n=1 Tax=Lysobacter sp. K5869 TaxID=2820808 RepID=UPI001C060993|nr:4Fe-4S dicluster domain-containing protein [Lysobacter sp. K5869]QWP78279.1 4Fe-4S dicluster domain-containing protein [Lysobacter sp. K5869]